MCVRGECVPLSSRRLSVTVLEESLSQSVRDLPQAVEELERGIPQRLEHSKREGRERDARGCRLEESER